jgi:hypothetical protein
MFTKNIGSADKIFRIIVGIAVLSLAFIGPATPWGYVGIVLIVTGFMNFCPLYTLFKFNTRK